MNIEANIDEKLLGIVINDSRYVVGYKQLTHKQQVDALKSLILELIEESKPDCNSIVQPDLSEVPDNAHWIHLKGQKYAASEYEANLKKALNH